MAAWAEGNNVPHRTAYRWAAEAGVKVRVRGLRQDLVTDAVGRLADAATVAVDTLRGLLAEGQPATVRLGAARDPVGPDRRPIALRAGRPAVAAGGAGGCPAS